MAIPVSVDVQIKPGVLSAAGTAVDLNGVILSDDSSLPLNTLKTFTSSDDVSDYFGSTSEEYSMASVYFSGYTNASTTPGTLYVWAFNTDARAAFLRSASWSGLSVSTLKGVSGELSLSVDNETVTGTVDLSSITSLAEAASSIGDALGDSVSVTYDTNTKALYITSSTTGSNSEIDYASGDAASSLYLTEDTGAVTSQGADAASVDDSMSSLKDATEDWALFTTSFECTTYQHILFAGWAADQNDRYAYVGWAEETQAKTSGSTDTFAYQIIETYDYNNTVPVYGDQAHAAGVMGYAASLNFDLTNGRRSLKFREQQGLITTVSSKSDHSALTTNGYNFYGSYAENKLSASYWAQGTITGDWEWLDAFCGQVWLNANLQSAILDLFTSETYLPYTNKGRTAIEAACTDVINQFYDWGGFETGITITNEQNQVITNTVGTDVSSLLYSQGYYLWIGDFTSTMRSERTTPTCYLWYQDGSVIQELTLNSVEVQ